MPFLTRFIILFPVIGFLCTSAYGDGRMYIPDRIPANIPYQRAFLIYNEGIETLILQSKYEFTQTADVNSIGWVVPVPSVPEIASVDADKAHRFFFYSSLTTQPHLFEIKVIPYFIILFLFLAAFISMVVLALLYPFTKVIGMSKTTWERWAGYSAKVELISLFILFIGGFLMPSLSKAGSGEVDIVKTEQVGIYDVKVIKGDSTEAIMDWLKENKYSFSEKDTDAFNNYVNRKWCFVTAKVSQDIESEKQEISLNGLVDPLILKFNTDKAIYPLALTSAIGTETEVLLYTLSKNKLSCHERMKLRYAGSKKTKGMFDSIMTKDQVELKAIFEKLPKEMIICKFKQKLTSEQMKQDLEFEDAPNNEPYRETKIVW